MVLLGRTSRSTTSPASCDGWSSRLGNVVLVHGAEAARSPATIARGINTVHAFLDYHATRGIPVARRLVSFSRTPKPHWRNPHRTGRATRRAVTVPVHNAAPETLTADEVQRLLDACHHVRDRFLLALLYETGMRVGQALGLRHEDFVSRQRLVRIVPRDKNPNGARAKTTTIHAVCISGELVRLYSDYMVDEYGALDSDFVFVNLWGRPHGHAMTKSGVNELTRSLRRRTGVVFTPHVLRHTNATELERLGVPVEVISRRLTHANLSTTVKTYIHIGVRTSAGRSRRPASGPGGRLHDPLCPSRGTDSGRATLGTGPRRGGAPGVRGRCLLRRPRRRRPRSASVPGAALRRPPFGLGRVMPAAPAALARGWPARAGRILRATGHRVPPRASREVPGPCLPPVAPGLRLCTLHLGRWRAAGKTDQDEWVKTQSAARVAKGSAE